MNIKIMIKKIFRCFYDQDYRYNVLLNKGVYRNVRDEEVLERLYYIHFREKLNLENPKTYTEKLQWLKLYDHQPIYTKMVDKAGAKDFVAERVGEEYIIPTLGIWDRFEDIDFDKLPERFVLKCTHDSGSYVICNDKKVFDVDKAKKKINKALKREYYYLYREWPYKNIKPRIIAEEYMEDTDDAELRDYKFFTFGGVPKVLYITQGRGKNQPTVADFFDMDFNHLPFTIDHDMGEKLPHPPKNFEEMKRIAAALSKGTPQLRVDFYEVNGKVYFGEMTFFHCSGFDGFHPEEWDEIFGDWVILPEKTV